ncbi:MAG: hypothetical protein H0W82_06110, partial [Actinobacteria bacterium]|nr:hypothetical protein [Actinomycetota bacterium]
LGTELDHDSLVDLGREAQRAAGDATAVPTLSSPSSGTPPPSGDEALACVRAGAGDVLSIQARVVRLLSAPFEGTPAFVAIAVTDPSEDATDIQIVVVAVAADSCRFLDSA